MCPGPGVLATFITNPHHFRLLTPCIAEAYQIKKFIFTESPHQLTLAHSLLSGCQKDPNAIAVAPAVAQQPSTCPPGSG